ncbi:cytochrome C [bacterium]|nr:cytochrome C [bacterium]MBU1990880.1 cytochrome C [bacterium]
MNKIIKIALGAAIVLGMSATTASADVAKGQKLFTKKLKAPCGMSGAAMAGKHTQGEWEEIFEDGGLADEIKKLCPSVNDGAIKDKYIEDYYDFFKEYGSDSGNVPSC